MAWDTQGGGTPLDRMIWRSGDPLIGNSKPEPRVGPNLRQSGITWDEVGWVGRGWARARARLSPGSERQNLTTD